MRLACALGLLVFLVSLGSGFTATAQTGCAHDLCIDGSRLDPACDPCVAAVCETDSYCCDIRWDEVCIDETGPSCMGLCGPQVDPAPNDDCVSATVIGATPFLDLVDTTAATEELSEPTLSCGSGGGGPTVWYHLTPERDGLVCVRTCGSSYDTVLAVLSGACGSLMEPGCTDPQSCCDDDSCGALQSRQDFLAVAGEPVFITVASYDGHFPGGPLLLTVAYEDEDEDGDGVPDCNDNCPTLANGDQADEDSDGLGDSCVAPDSDLDGVLNPEDNCPGTANSAQVDADLDGAGDACDNCRFVANPPGSSVPGHRSTGGQVDDDLDGIGNACDADFTEADGDDFVNVTDLLRFLAAFGRPITAEDCPGPGDDLGSCARYDLNATGAVVNVSDLVMSISPTLFGQPSSEQGCGEADGGMVECPLGGCFPGLVFVPETGECVLPCGKCELVDNGVNCPADCGCEAAGCGGQAPDGCRCDPECVSFGDCCSDACAVCGHCE